MEWEDRETDITYVAKIKNVEGKEKSPAHVWKDVATRKWISDSEHVFIYKKSKKKKREESDTPRRVTRKHK